MALFAVNTGLPDSNVCGLQWQWEVAVLEIGGSVFVIPPEAFKTKRPHVVILNDVTWSVIESQRGKHPIWVFLYRGRCIGKMNNNGWQQARQEAGLPLVRVHDLRHSFACRPPRRRRVRRRSRSAPRPCESFDGRSLRQCQHRTPAQRGESDSQPQRYTDRVTRGHRLPRTDPNGPASSTDRKRIWFCAPST